MRKKKHDHFVFLKICCVLFGNGITAVTKAVLFVSDCSAEPILIEMLFKFHFSVCFVYILPFLKAPHFSYLNDPIFFLPNADLISSLILV